MMRTNFRAIPSLALVVSLLLSCLSSTGQTSRKRVSLILTNGKVFTADDKGTMVEAVAIDGERIVAVGTTADINSKFTAERSIDLAGKLVTPGFNDAHIHF